MENKLKTCKIEFKNKYVYLTIDSKKKIKFRKEEVTLDLNVNFKPFFKDLGYFGSLEK